MIFLKQSVAFNALIGPMLSATDGNTISDSLTITKTDLWLSKNHGTLANPGQSVTLVAQTQGIYAMSVSSADANTAGPLTLWLHVAGYLAVWHEFMVLPANVYDSLVGGTDNLQVDVREIGAGGVISAGVFANDAITSATLAASAGTELATALWLAVNMRAGALSAAVFDTGAITSAAFAANVSPQQVLNNYDPPTKTEMDAGFAALNDIAVADVWAGIIDTLDAQTTLKWLLANNAGAIGVTGNAYAYKAYDQSTTLYTLTASTTMRTRS